jgi:membrane-bound ClpP family serine protease
VKQLINTYLGVALVFTGALLLIVSYLAGFTNNNLVLLTGLIIIILGVVLHVRHQKKDEKY